MNLQLSTPKAYVSPKSAPCGTGCIACHTHCLDEVIVDRSPSEPSRPGRSDILRWLADQNISVNT